MAIQNEVTTKLVKMKSTLDRKNLCVYLVIVALFSISLYTVTKSYLRYETVTNVDWIRKAYELPKIDSFLCIEKKHIYLGSNYSRDLITYHDDADFWIKNTYDMEYLEMVITMNGIGVNVSNSTEANVGSKCWELKYESAYNFISEESFELRGRTKNLTENVELWKVLRPKSSDGYLYYYEPTVSFETLVFYGDHDDSVEYNTFILELLEFPYSTNCFRYDHNQHDCYMRCAKDFRLDSNDSTTNCSFKCIRQDCTQLYFFMLYTQRFQRLVENSHHLWIGNHVLGFHSHPIFTFSLYTLQFLGLVTTFFGSMILNIKGPLLHVISLIFSSQLKNYDPLKRRRKRKKRRKFRRLIKHIVPKIIFVCCVLHIIHHTAEYFKYSISSETRIGKQDDIFIPYISLCFDGSKDVLDKIIPGVSLNVTSYPRLNSSFLLPTLEYSDDQFKCYMFKSRLEYLSNDRLSRSIFQINIIPTRNNSLSISMDHRAFPSSPDIVNTMTDYTACKTYVIEQFNLPPPYESSCTSDSDIGMMTNYSYSNQMKHQSDKMKSFAPKYTNSIIPCTERWMFIKKILCYFDDYQSLSLNKPDISIVNTLNPNQSMIDFITYTASILSLWIGFNFVSLPDMLIFGKWLTTKHNGLRFMLYIIFIVLFSFHLYQVISGYMKYEIISSIKMGKPISSSNLPTISLFFNFRIFNYTKPLFSDKSYKEFSWFSPKYLNGLSNNFRSIENIIPKIQLSSNGKKNNFTFDELNSIIDYYVCKREKIVTFDFNRIVDIKTLNISQIHFDWVELNGGHFLKFYMINELVTLDDGEERRLISSIFLNNRRYPNIYKFDPSYPAGRSAIIIYESYQTKLLKDPYISRCVDYVDPLKEENSHLSCMINNHMNLYNRVPNSIPIPIHYNVSRIDEDGDIKMKCYELHHYRPQCDDTYYQIFMELNENSPDGLEFEPPKVETICQFLPKSSLFDLSILICDVFGLWLGISLCFILKKIVSVTECCSYRKDLLVGH